MRSPAISSQKGAFNLICQISVAGIMTLMLLASCHNNPDIKAPDAIKDSVLNGGSGGSVGKDSANAMSARTHADTVTADIPSKHGARKDNVKKLLKKLEDSTGSKNSTLSQVPAKDNTAVQKVQSAPAAIIAKPVESQPTGADANDKFVSKYGVIPRNTTETNINSFIEAFPDKSILVKVNFDGTADPEMTGVRNQIIKVLKNLGYNNIAAQPASIEPIRMPKEIHYELQRNGSVIVWIPINNPNQ